MEERTKARLDRLRETLTGLGKTAVAFSGGVDSSCLLAVSREVLGDQVIAVTGVSPSPAGRQLEQAGRVAATLGVEHRLLATDEMSEPGYTANPENRCWFCKSELFGRMRRELGDGVTIIEGSNADDASDHRPGMAAAREHGVRSPLREAGLTKADVRAISRKLGLETAEAPAQPCLASRLPYGLEVTRARLKLVERAEDALRARGFRELRVRHLGDRARIEIGADEHAAAVCRKEELEASVRAVGFDAAQLDDRPFRSGVLNDEAGLRDRASS